MVANPLIVLDYYGASRIEPSIFSRITIDASVQPRFLALRDVILLSAFEGGVPGILTPFISPTTLQQVFDPENLHIQGVDLTQYMVVPSFDTDVRGAYRIYGTRVGAPTQAQYTFVDGSAAPVLLVKSADYGTYVNKLSAEITAGTVVGKKVILRFGTTEMTTLDNLQNALHLAYKGNGSAATATITRAADHATRLQTTLTGQTDGSINLDLDLAGADFTTIQALALYINAQNGYRASIDPYADSVLASSELDAVSALSIRLVPAFTVQYIGAGTPVTMTITDTALTTAVTGAAGDNLTMDLTVSPTNTLAGVLAAFAAKPTKYTVTLGANADLGLVTQANLTNVAAQDILSAPYSVVGKATKQDFVARAALGTIIHAINTRATRFVASRVATAITVPASISQTFLAGGTNPSTVLNDWLSALNVVDAEDLDGGIVFVNTTDSSIQAAVLAWVYGQKIQHGKAFRAVFGAPPGDTATNYQALASGFNSTQALLAFQRILGPDALTQLPPLYAAAIMCGLTAGVPDGQTVTGIAIRARGLVDKYPLGVREQLMSAGLSVLKEAKGVGILTAFMLATSLSVNRIDRVWSETMARDTIDQEVRASLLPFLRPSAWGTKDLIPKVKGAVREKLMALERRGVITSGIDSNGTILPAFQPVQVSLLAGLLTVQWAALFGGEIDQIGILGVIGYQRFEISSPVSAAVVAA